MSALVDKAQNKVKETTSEVSSQVGKLIESGGQAWVIILIIVAMVILVLIVIYIVSMVKKTSLQSVVLQPSIITLDNRSAVPYSVPSANMSLVSNGQEFSYSFWIFLGGSYKPTAQHKILIQRGNQNQYSGSLLQIGTSTNPLIMLDKSANMMYFAVKTNAVTAAASPSTIFSRDSNGVFNGNTGHLVTYIDYVPLQRWVNVALVVKNTAIYIYMDADLYSVISLSDLKLTTNLNPMMSGSTGDLAIGDNVMNTPGFISLTRFYNYALGQPDLQTLYNNGPALTTWLSYLGLGNYGVRSPVYEVTSS